MSLEKFKQFSKKPSEVIVCEKKEVWIYTRVSSKDQEMNKSLMNQKNASYEYAATWDYNISNVFGGVYESASGDFTRKEFSRLITEVKKARKKPFAILIYTMSRFSRTGGNGIALANELVEELGVSLIEVCTGKNTLTPQGKNEIYASLLQAHKENIDRLKVTIPGMKLFLKSGGWLGKAARGYDTFGKRVKRDGFLDHIHKIVMNEEGKKIKLAWQWKLAYETDVEIQKRLKAIGVHMSTQDISKMWRKPFYCGVNVNSLLDEPIRGNWEPMVTEQEFLLVQDIISGKRKSGYKIDNNSLKRPLTLFLRCNECGEKLTSYEVKKKRLHYYKCQKCNGVTINADTGKRSRGMGAHEMFRCLLSYFQLDSTLNDPFKMQLLYTYNALNQDKAKESEILRRELDALNEELKTLRRNHAFGKVDKQLFEEFKTEQEGKIQVITGKLSKIELKISNLDLYINLACDVARNLNKYWELYSIETKRRIQNTIFPGGLYLDAYNRAYLTKKINTVFKLCLSVSGNTEKKEGDLINYFIEKSPLVARERIELSTSGL